MVGRMFGGLDDRVVDPPPLLPRRLVNSGTGAISSMFDRFIVRRSNCPTLNETPWSAVTTISRVVVGAGALQISWVRR